VDAANITDCQTAIVRMSSIAAGIIAREEGVEPVIQMTCRTATASPCRAMSWAPMHSECGIFYA